MTDYKCKDCTYKTRDKSNYARHLKAKSHQPLIVSTQVVTLSTQKSVKNKKNYMCDICNNGFTTRQALSRHKSKYCTGKKDDVNELKEELSNVKNEMKEYKNIIDKLLNYIQTNKPTVNNNYISVKNYVQQNFPNAPALEGPKDYAKLAFEDNDLIDSLIYNYQNEILHKYLGKFIISYYKKDDPSEQSLWASDVSRLTYVIKELLESNKSIWSHDFKGVKVKICIVNPLLRYIRKCIDDYWISNVDNMKSLDTKELVKLQEKFIALQKIKQDIGNELIANNIVRYIAPHFYMKKNDPEYVETNEMFIDMD
ncbi:zinc finger C2H2-type protein [Fadolivirus algeromassiliense]|jgi:hypothetical protein|uniref:Zinc finger C2H2-type protein n=1 Tax=Fadolivirus FV1/VV64 TaxID=3070911 RepID=A0A7D3QXZ7_9VIRU|nr:zinc finger C2H2-type protein [Fadolivirus algeromassiliense]QKF94860.1 zinc finger C2H2-type protein [Fadolivirus FV1/VV64]